MAGLGLRGIVAIVPPLQGSGLALDDNELRTFSSVPLHLWQKRQEEGVAVAEAEVSQKRQAEEGLAFEAYGVRAPVFLSRSCLPGVMPDRRSSRARSEPWPQPVTALSPATQTQSEIHCPQRFWISGFRSHEMFAQQDSQLSAPQAA